MRRPSSAKLARLIDGRHPGLLVTAVAVYLVNFASSGALRIVMCRQGRTLDDDDVLVARQHAPGRGLRLMARRAWH
jgi:hypothetical protein